jgi:bifunctional DNase/RNase
MNDTYQWTIGGIEAGVAGFAAVVFRSSADDYVLRVRLNPDEAQTFAAELTGLHTPRTRMAQVVSRVAEQLDARLHSVRLHRSAATIVEAELVLAGVLGETTLPVTFGDGVALALAHKLPVTGDQSLDPLLQPIEVAAQTVNELEVALPANIEAFLNSLSDM